MDQKINLLLGRRLRSRRRLMGLTQTQLAIRVGVRFQQIQKYENGANRISAARLWRFCQALEVPVSYFFDGLPLDPSPLPEPCGDHPVINPRAEVLDRTRLFHLQD